MIKTKVINLFGEPSSGKSTLASRIFFELKLLGYNAELITEFAKELVYAQRKKCLGDQFYVIAQQNHRMYSMLGQVDYIITDSPILLGAVYQTEDYPASFSSFLLDLHNEYTNINYFLLRDFAFQKEGRVHDEEQSNKIHKELLSFLTVNFIPFNLVKNNPETYKTILEEQNLI